MSESGTFQITFCQNATLPKVLLITLVKGNYPVCGNTMAIIINMGSGEVFWLAPLFWKFAPPVYKVRRRRSGVICGAPAHLWLIVIVVGTIADVCSMIAACGYLLIVYLMAIVSLRVRVTLRKVFISFLGQSTQYFYLIDLLIF